MSDFEMENDEFELQLDAMLDQLGPDRLPAGFTTRTMAAIRLESASVNAAYTLEPFRVHWSDFVPAITVSIVGTVILFIWLALTGTYSLFNWVQTEALFGSTTDVQLATIFTVVGLCIAAISLLPRNIRSRNNMWLLALG